MQQELLSRFKKSLGIIVDDGELDEYYSELIVQSTALISNEDISEEILSGELGQSAIILAAKALMNNEDVTENKTIILMRSALSNSTKGARWKDAES